MSIYQLWQERKAEQKFIRENNDAQKRFNEQKNAIVEIVKSRGFDEIVKYFRTVEKSAINLVISSTGERALEAKIEARVCGKFLRFLENLATD